MHDDSPSVEGFLVGIVAGHYQLRKSKLVEATDVSHDLQGETWVSRDKVFFLQVLP